MNIYTLSRRGNCFFFLLLSKTNKKTFNKISSAIESYDTINLVINTVNFNDGQYLMVKNCLGISN